MGLSFKPAWRPGQQQNSLILALIILTSLKMSPYFLSNHLRKDYDNEGKDHDKNDENILTAEREGSRKCRQDHEQETVLDPISLSHLSNNSAFFHYGFIFVSTSFLMPIISYFL